MANGFKRIGGSYVSKLGNNANSGLTDALPKQTITAGLSVGSGNAIVLSGVYKESLSLGRRLVGDGIARLDGGNIRTLSVNLSNAEAFLNFSIINYTTVNSLGNYQECYLKNLTFNYVADNSSQGFTNCTFINVIILPVTTGGASFTRNTLFNTIVNLSTQAMVLSSNYIDNSVECLCNQNPTPFVNNNFRGKFTKAGISYCVPTGSDITISGGSATVIAFASRTGSYPSGCTDWIHVGLGQTATTCYVTNGNFNADPQFVDVFNEDFSVLPSSPMIGKGSGGTNIGNVKVTNTSLRRTATQGTPTNLTGTTDLSVESPNLTGEWVSSVITIDALNPRVFQRPTYVGNLSFDSSSAGNVPNVNDNVPWIPTYVKNGVTRNNQTLKQLRPCLLVRFSNKNIMPSATVDSDWDNGNNNTTTVSGILAGEYFLCELNADFRYDANGFGSADVDFNDVVNSQLATRYCMYKVILTDKYPTV